MKAPQSYCFLGKNNSPQGIPTSCFEPTLHELLKEPAQLVPPFSRGRFTRYSDRLYDFSVTIPRCYKDVYVNSFFLRTARLWNSLPLECFPLAYDLSGFKSRINRHLLTVRLFKTDFLCAVILLCFFSCNSMARSGCSDLHGVNHN